MVDAVNSGNDSLSMGQTASGAASVPEADTEQVSQGYDAADTVSTAEADSSDTSSSTTLPEPEAVTTKATAFFFQIA